MMLPLASYSTPLRRDRRAQARNRLLQHMALVAGACALGLILAHVALKTALDVQNTLSIAQIEGPLQ